MGPFQHPAKTTQLLWPAQTAIAAVRFSSSSDLAISIEDVLFDVWDDVHMHPIKFIPVPEPAAGHPPAQLLPDNSIQPQPQGPR